MTLFFEFVVLGSVETCFGKVNNKIINKQLYARKMRRLRKSLCKVPGSLSAVPSVVERAECPGEVVLDLRGCDAHSAGNGVVGVMV